MATGGRSDVNFNVAVKLPELKNPVWYNICGSISCISRVLANFLSKFSNFCYHGNRGRSEERNFNDTVKLFDIENPLFGATATCVALSLVIAKF